MLDILLESGNDSFYKDSSKYLTIDGYYTDILN